MKFGLEFIGYCLVLLLAPAVARGGFNSSGGGGGKCCWSRSSELCWLCDVRWRTGTISMRTLLPVLHLRICVASATVTCSKLVSSMARM